MSHFFLCNAAIDIDDFDVFKNGISELISIKRLDGHSFWKNEDIYNLPVVINKLFTSLSGQHEQEVFRFIEQLPVCEKIIHTEDEANEYSNLNGFLGIQFSPNTFSLHKEIKNEFDYKTWCYQFHQKLEDLLQTHEEPAIVHLAPHAGLNIQIAFTDKLRKCKYVKEIQSTDWGGQKFIKGISEDFTIDVVMHWTAKSFAFKVFTTARNKEEAKIIADFISREYDK